MSEIREEIKTVISRYSHNFFCDDCGMLILQSTEFEDGYYSEPMGFSVKNIKLNGHYCKECGKARVKRVIEYARSQNFDI